MTVYVLGPFRLDTKDDLLLRGSEPVTLGRRAIALLRALIDRPGTLVSKDTLIEAAWPGQLVEESNLTVQIAALRRVLEEAPGGDRWIETMPRRGYRFVAPVVTAGEEGVMAPAEADAEQVPASIPHFDAERRQITAMSCELVGISGGADGVGLEDLREAVGAFHRCASEVVYRHKGFVASRLGNAGLILFGYPAADENDAEQAVRAGLELCAAVRTLESDANTLMRCRIGIASGMTILTNLGDAGALRDREIVGDAPNLAVQLRLSARPDTVAIDPATKHLIGNLFDCRDLGTIDTTDGAEPMHAWQVVGGNIVASRFEALRGSALTQLIGRDEEIDLLLRRWARAEAGDGQVVLVSGEAGLGKSRMTAALQERFKAEPLLWLRYFCSPYHQDSALSPFADQLSRAAGFAREDPHSAKLEKLESLLVRAAPPAEDFALLADLLSLPASARYPLPTLSPQRKKERTLEALIHQLEGLARQQPVVVVFEDAHWIDPTSRELLDIVVERVRTLPILLIVTFRPTFQTPWTDQPHVTMLALNRLNRRDRISLVGQVARKALPDIVIDQIVERTDGVPLFVEELTKSVIESGLLRAETDRYVLDGALPAFAIPTTLYASLLARLDRPASARLVAQTGAAIGREFTYTLLRAVSRLPEDELQTALARLVASELVFQRGKPPNAVYSFKHALVQDVAHDSLLRRARQQLHGQIAQTLEAESPELMKTRPELFARHYAEAGLVKKSVDYWGKAGLRSAAHSASAEAVAQFQKGLDQLALLPDTPQRQRQELEFRSALGAVLIAVKGFTAAETGDAYARARAVWEQLGSPSEFLQVPYGQSLYHAVRGEFDLAQRLDEDLLRLSRERNDAASLVMAHWSTGRDLMFVGRFASSRSHLEQALALYDPIAHHSLVEQAGFHFQVVLRAYLAIVLFCLGLPDQALEYSGAALAEARRLPHPPSLVTSLTFGCRLLSLVGDDKALEEQADEVCAVTFEQGLPYWRAIGAIYQGWVKAKNGAVTEAMSLLHGGLSAYRASGARTWMPHHLVLLARAYETAGQVEEAVASLDEALQIVESTGERWFAAEVCRHNGELMLRQERPGSAEELYHKALSIAQEQGARLWELRAATSLARLRRDQGRYVEDRDLLAPVYGWFTEGFGLPDLKAAKSLLDSLPVVPAVLLAT
jgi:DNA-binding winged helix-turn-helix (wHTH) protein/predicted ATPase